MQVMLAGDLMALTSSCGARKQKNSKQRTGARYEGAKSRVKITRTWHGAERAKHSCSLILRGQSLACTSRNHTLGFPRPIQHRLARTCTATVTLFRAQLHVFVHSYMVTCMTCVTRQ
jgi:hypothetical protein